MASSYTAAFRAEAVKSVLEQHLNVPQAAKQLATPKQTLDKWCSRRCDFDPAAEI